MAATMVQVDSRHSVLLVDPIGRSRLGPMLERCGFAVRWSATAEAALFELGDHDIDAIVAAFPLPGLGVGGLTQESRVRGHPPVLAVTTDERVEGVDALRAGAHDHIAAPVDGREMRARLLALIRRVRGPLSPRRSVSVGELTVHLGRGMTAVEPRFALTPVQCTLLGHLAGQPGVVTRDGALRERVQAVHGPISRCALDAELRGLQVAIDVASGIQGACERLDGMGWRLAAAEL